MSSSRRRFAGILLAGRPLEDVSQQLAEAQGKLASLRKAREEGALNDGPRSFNKTIDLGGGHKAHLNAHGNYPRFTYADPVQGPLAAPVLGDKQTFDMLAANPPTAEYNLAWDIDGSHYGSDLSNKDKVRAGRAVQKGWTELISQMPEGALVSNSPVGAQRGDFGRADAYMSNGFGPLQDDGQQYGVIQGGQIVPISPGMADREHAQHLAKKARMAGQTEMSDAVLSALKDPRREEVRSFKSDGPALASNKGSIGPDRYVGYDDRYDDYYDDREDYLPPVNVDDLKFIAEDPPNFPRRTDIPEIEQRERLSGVIAEQGFDSGIPFDERQNNPGDERSPYNDVAGEDIERFRQLQLREMQNPDGSIGRNLADALQRLSPRRPPQRITTEDLGNRLDLRARDPILNVTQIEDLPPAERRGALVDLVRSRLDQGRIINDFTPRKQASTKEVMLDFDERMTDGDEIGGYLQMLYQDGDVQAAREVQELLAQAGAMTPDIRRDGTVFEEGVRRRALRGSRATAPAAPEAQFGGQMGRGVRGEVEDLPAGFQVQERGPLNSDQMGAYDAMTRMYVDGRPEGMSDAAFDRKDGRVSRALQSAELSSEALPIRRNPMAAGQMSVEVPGAGTLRRPNPFIASVEERLPASERLVPDTRARINRPAPIVAPAGAGTMFDEYADYAQGQQALQVPGFSTPSPALQRNEPMDMYQRDERRRGLAAIAERDPIGLEGRRRRRRGEYSAPVETQREELPTLYAPRPELPSAPDPDFYYHANGLVTVTPAPMREQMAHQAELVRILNAPRERFQPEYNLDGVPIMGSIEIGRFGGANTMDEFNDFRNRYNIASSVETPQSERFASRDEALAARRNLQRQEFADAPDNMSMDEFRSWARQRERTNSWNAAPMDSDLGELLLRDE